MGKFIKTMAFPLILTMAIFSGSCSSPSGNGPDSYTRPGPWPEGFNVFIYGTPPQDFVRAVHGTILAWSVYGFGVSNADRAYVDLMHSIGAKVMANLITMQGISAGNEKLARRASCRTLHGEPARAFWIQPNPPYLMCHNNHELQVFLKTRMKDQVDGMADGIQIDEIEGIGGHLYLAGFCDSCMAAFRSHLSLSFTPYELRTRFGIEDIGIFNYKDYLLSFGARGPWYDPNVDLRREFVRFQMMSRKVQIEQLIRETRTLAGREIKFSGNTFFLSSNKQPFIQDLDFMVFENTLLMPPMGKYVGTYLLGRAMGGERDVVMFPDIIVLALLGTNNYAVIRHWITEAYASGSAFLLPKDAYTFGGHHLPLPAEEVSPITDFLYLHRDLYSYSRAVSRVALIYDYSTALGQYIDKWYRMPWFAGEEFHVSFLGVSVALQEAHIPFDVVYLGDGDFVVDPLTLSKIEDFDAVILPYVGALDEAGEDILARYESLGRKVVRIYGMMRNYWLLRDRLVRERLSRMVDDATGGGMIQTNAPESLSIIPRISTSLDVHFVNYAYNTGSHEFDDATGISLSLQVPKGVRLQGKRLFLHSPGEEDLEIGFHLEEDRVNFTVPRITNYAVASFR